MSVTWYDLMHRNSAVDLGMGARPMLQRHQMEFLYDLARVAAEGPGLEVGTYCGASLIAWGLARQYERLGPLYVIDPFDWRSMVGEVSRIDRFRQHMAYAGLEPTILIGRSDEMADQAPDSLGFAFIDGDHNYEGVAFDIRAFAPRIVPGGIIVFDDYNYGPNVAKVGVKRAVDEWQGAIDPAWDFLGKVGNIVAWRRPMAYGAELAVDPVWASGWTAVSGRAGE